MCCCGKPTINGEPNAYSWDGKTFLTHTVNPPELSEADSLLFDEPGRCGAVDSHCHHFRLVKNGCLFFLLVQHCGGIERIQLASWNDHLSATLLTMDTNTRYWLIHSIYRTANKVERETINNHTSRWANAFVDKRIKKQKRNGTVRVWIDNE
jgi:hypothetical protein